MIFKAKSKKQRAKSFVYIFLLFTFYFLLSVPVSAQESTPSGSLIQKLNELKKEIASKAAEIKTVINKKVQDKAIIGSILRIEDSELILQTLDSTKTVKYDEFTEVVGLKNKKIKIDTLEEDDRIAALGDMDDKNNLVAKRIIFVQNSATNSGELIWGQIQKSSGSNISLKTRSNEVKTILTNGQTVFYLGNNEASIADAKAEKFMVAKGTLLKDGSIRARFIYFIPSVGFVKPSQKSASPSASTKN